MDTTAWSAEVCPEDAIQAGRGIYKDKKRCSRHCAICKRHKPQLMRDFTRITLIISHILSNFCPPFSI